MDAKQHTLSVLLLPWLAHGHISPFLELAKRLSVRNFHVYLCSTPMTLCSINKQLNKEAFPSVQLVELHLPSFPELPPHYHTTKALPPHLMPTLKKAFDMAKPSFANLMTLLNPDLLVYDFLQPWAPEVASSQNIPAVMFMSTGASACSFIHHALINPVVPFPYPAIYLHDHEIPKIVRLFESSANNLEDTERVWQCSRKSVDIILVKTFREIEAKYIDYYSVLSDKRIVPVGPLVQEPIEEDDQVGVIEWLNRKNESSVVFVSFGSEYFLSKEESEEIAHALDLSKVNFIWAVRFPEGEKIKVDEVLPEGFLERVGERGMILEGWAPQLTILRHSSIGGFVSHCGWSSVMEAMNYGVPIIAMPMHLDQPLNARLVAEVGAGVEVKRAGMDGMIERGEVAKVIKEVVVEERGEEVRRKAKKISEVTKKKGDEEIDVVVEKLLQIHKNYQRWKLDLEENPGNNLMSNNVI